MEIPSIYTDIQQEMIAELRKEANLNKKRADELQLKLKNPLISFDENKRIRKAQRQFQEKYEDIMAEIEDIENAQDELNECIAKAKRCMDRAESLMNTYNLNYTGGEQPYV